MHMWMQAAKGMLDRMVGGPDPWKWLQWTVETVETVNLCEGSDENEEYSKD